MRRSPSGLHVAEVGALGLRMTGAPIFREREHNVLGRDAEAEADTDLENFRLLLRRNSAPVLPALHVRRCLVDFVGHRPNAAESREEVELRSHVRICAR